MTTIEIIIEYIKLKRTIKNTRIYDGRGEKIDVYVCPNCGPTMFTKYGAKGVTPFCVVCRKCGVTEAYHKATITSASLPRGVVIRWWVRPTLWQTLRLSNGEIKHVLDGGLILDLDLLRRGMKPKIEKHLK